MPWIGHDFLCTASSQNQTSEVLHGVDDSGFCHRCWRTASRHRCRMKMFVLYSMYTLIEYNLHSFLFEVSILMPGSGLLRNDASIVTGIYQPEMKLR